MKLEPPHIPAQTWEQEPQALERLLDREEVLSGCWEGCDLSGLDARGAQFARSSLRAVSFTGCRLAGSGFAALRARQTLWKGCDLSRCALTAGQLKDVAFSDCDLTAAQFFRTPLNGIDLTSCRLDGLVLSDGAPELRGAIVDRWQAAELARFLGLVLRD